MKVIISDLMKYEVDKNQEISMLKAEIKTLQMPLHEKIRECMEYLKKKTVGIPGKECLDCYHHDISVDLFKYFNVRGMGELISSSCSDSKKDYIIQKLRGLYRVMYPHMFEGQYKEKTKELFKVR